MSYYTKIQGIANDYYADLNDWERTFVDDMNMFLQDDDELTKYQKSKIDELVEKYT